MKASLFSVSIMRSSMYIVGWLFSLSALAQNPAPASSDYIRNPPAATPKLKKTVSVIAYGEGLYTLSDAWTDPVKGPGILSGAGGGLLATYYLKPRLGLTGQIGYSQWGVRRRYVAADGADRFTNDQTVSRLVVQIGPRLYLTRLIYFQPMVGGQQLTLTSLNSATHPNGVNEVVTKKFLPTLSGNFGVEIPLKKLLIDLGVQYSLVPSSDFAGITQPLQFAGLRLGIGYHSK